MRFWVRSIIESRKIEIWANCEWSRESKKLWEFEKLHSRVSPANLKTRIVQQFSSQHGHGVQIIITVFVARWCHFLLRGLLRFCTSLLFESVVIVFTIASPIFLQLWPLASMHYEKGHCLKPIGDGNIAFKLVALSLCLVMIGWHCQRINQKRNVATF